MRKEYGNTFIEMVQRVVNDGINYYGWNEALNLGLELVNRTEIW